MTEHEKRAEDVIEWLLEVTDVLPTDTIAGKMQTKIGVLLDQAHAAGFEAGLKARLPSEDEVCKAAADSEHGYKYSTELAFIHGAHWLAANMRNEGA